jgi:hypothetical protein
LNEELVCEGIEYFRAAFKGGFEVSEETSIEMVEDDAEAFARVVDVSRSSTIRLSAVYPVSRNAFQYRFLGSTHLEAAIANFVATVVSLWPRYGMSRGQPWRGRDVKSSDRYIENLDSRREVGRKRSNKEIF